MLNLDDEVGEDGQGDYYFLEDAEHKEDDDAKLPVFDWPVYSEGFHHGRCRLPNRTRNELYAYGVRSRLNPGLLYQKVIREV